MSDLREKLKVAMLATKYESTTGRGQRGYMEHHVEALLDTIMPIVEPEDGIVVTFTDADPSGEYAGCIKVNIGEGDDVSALVKEGAEHALAALGIEPEGDYDERAAD